MKKEAIIREIKRTARENGGKPLGKKRFERETGIKESDWLGKLWPRWNVAVEEAGFEPNVMTEAHSDEDLLQPLVNMIQDLGHFPTRPEQRIRRRNDQSFPPPECISRRWGSKSQVASKLIE